MSNRSVALLRGINVGRAKRIAMADLRALFDRLGYAEVRTLLNSGNVVFTSPDAAEGDQGPRIQQAIAEQLGVSCRVITLSAREVAAIMAGNPLVGVAHDHSRLLVAILSRAEDRALLETLAQRDWGDEALALSERAAYLWCANGILESILPEQIGRALGDRTTTRNWATMTKLAALL